MQNIFLNSPQQHHHHLVLSLGALLLPVPAYLSGKVTGAQLSGSIWLRLNPIKQSGESTIDFWNIE